MAILIPVRKQGQKNRGERIKIESILYVRTHLKITKPKEIFQYKHFFKGEALRLYSLFFTRIDFIKVLLLKSANFKNIIRINPRLKIC